MIEVNIIVWVKDVGKEIKYKKSKIMTKLRYALYIPVHRYVNIAEHTSTSKNNKLRIYQYTGIYLKRILQHV